MNIMTVIWSWILLILITQRLIVLLLYDKLVPLTALLLLAPSLKSQNHPASRCSEYAQYYTTWKGLRPVSSRPDRLFASAPQLPRRLNVLQGQAVGGMPGDMTV